MTHCRISPGIAGSIALATLLFASPPAPAADAKAAGGNWQHWRGPTGNGVSPDADPPLT